MDLARTALRGGLGILCLSLVVGCDAATTSALGLPFGDGAIIDFAPDVADVGPEVHLESYSVLMNSELVVDAATGVLTNDRFVEGVESFAGLTEAGGFVELNEVGAFRYVPPIGYTGADHFTYHVTNAHGAADARVLIKIVSPEDVPVP